MEKSKDHLIIFNSVVEELSKKDSYGGLLNERGYHEFLPSVDKLQEVMKLTRMILFPGYFGHSQFDQKTVKFHLGVNIERLFHLLAEQFYAGLLFEQNNKESHQNKNFTMNYAMDMASKIINCLPELRKILITDISAAYLGDPAAISIGEIIFCYPVIHALINYRLAHEIFLLGVPLIPRIMTEMAHSVTGIDIHPGAKIGHHFTIDHGTGVVIGATCIIGNNVKLYQGVTLGAKNFPLGPDGNPIKGIARHPVLKDNVIVYSNATILGRITIGEGAVIGGNVCVTEDVPDRKRIIQPKE